MLQRFKEDLELEAAKLTGHTLLVVESILEALQQVATQAYTQKYTLPSASESASKTHAAPVLLSRPQISIGTHTVANGDPAYRPTLGRHQTLQAGQTSPRRANTAGLLKSPPPTSEYVESCSFYTLHSFGIEFNDSVSRSSHFVCQIVLATALNF